MSSLSDKIYAAIIHLHDSGVNCGDLVCSRTAADRIAAEITETEQDTP